MKKIESIMSFFSGIIVGAMVTVFMASTALLNGVYTIAFVGIAAALMTIFIDYLISPKQIFGFWQNALKAIENSPFKPLAKPLGTCIYCMNVYVYTACFVVLYIHTKSSWWYFIPGASLSHVALAYIDRKINS
jgi:hypothetical protein